MSEVTPSPQTSSQSPEWRVCTLKRVDKTHKEIIVQFRGESTQRIIQTGEHDLSVWQATDVCEVKEMNGFLHGIRTLPGTAPIAPPKTIEQPKEPEKHKYQVRIVKRAEGKVLIHNQKGVEEWFQTTEDAQNNLKRLKDGQLIVLGFEGEKIKMLLPANEEGKYDKELWVKGSGGFGGRSYNPEAEKARQLSIETQNARIISKDIIALCMQQYPLSAEPNNYERVVALFPQLMEMVKKGEGILMGGKK